MAEMKTFNTRIKLRIDTLENWQSSTATLLPGEVAFATVAADAGLGLEEPVIMAKIATEEGKTFSQLPWAFHAKSSDVLAACKSADELTAFVNGVIKNSGLATDGAMKELAADVESAEGKIATLEGTVGNAEGGLVKGVADNAAAIAGVKGLVGDTAVATQIQNAIAELKLGETYAAKSLEKTVSDHVADTVAHVTTADKTKWNAALQASDIAAGSANGTVAVKGTDVAVTGLGSAAFTESSAYEVSGAAAQALTDAKAYAKEYADGLAKNYDATGSAAAAEAAAKAYADGLAGNYDEDGAAAQALVDAKAYVDAQIDEWVGAEDTVAEQISAAITAENLSQYETKTDASGKLAEAKKHATDLNTAMDERVQALEAIDHDHENKEVLYGITAEKVAAWDAAEANAKEYADGLDEAMDERVAAIEAKFGNGEGNVEAQISKAVADEAALREAADNAQVARIAALEGKVGDDVVANAISAAVAAEKERAEGIEGGLETRLAAVEGDYLKAADKTELQGNIDTVNAAVERLTNGVSAEEVDGVNDLIQYVKDHGTEVTGIKADIKANSDAIAEEAERAAGVESGLDTRLQAVETASATHAKQADLEAVSGRVTTVEGKVTTLEGEMDAVEGRAIALETKVGDKTVQAQISEAIEALKIGDYAKAADLTAAITQHNTDKAALEASIATKANDADLAAVAKSGLIDDLTLGADTVLVFDCGNAGVSL